MPLNGIAWPGANVAGPTNTAGVVGTLSITTTLVNVTSPPLLTTPEMVVSAPGATGTAGQFLVTTRRAVMVMAQALVTVFVAPVPHAVVPTAVSRVGSEHTLVGTT